MTAPAAAAWTTRKLLDWMRDHFAQREIEPARQISEMLMAHVLRTERLRLYMEPDRPASPEERDQLRDAVRRVVSGEPVQFLVGWTTFYSERIAVAPVTQIPQPCTEELVAAVVRLLRAQDRPIERLLDVGTGTGCIAIALARAFPSASLVAIDVAEEAVQLAQRNARELGLADRIDVRTGDLCAPLKENETFDALLSNPPYIPDAEWEGGLVEASVKAHIPERALRGGADGLDIIRRLVSQAPAALRPGGIVGIEVADVHAKAAETLVSSHFVDVVLHCDEDGLRRFITGRKRG